MKCKGESIRNPILERVEIPKINAYIGKGFLSETAVRRNHLEIVQF
jgi:hypothetical protein